MSSTRVPFAIQFLMYAAPVVYPTSLIPSSVRYLYALNPMVGVIEGFRACVAGIDASSLGPDCHRAPRSSTTMLALGAVYFRSKGTSFR